MLSEKKERKGDPGLLRVLVHWNERRKEEGGGEKAGGRKGAKVQGGNKGYL